MPAASTMVGTDDTVTRGPLSRHVDLFSGGESPTSFSFDRTMIIADNRNGVGNEKHYATVTGTE
jgi:hypothetical protein